jgi:hypothetical protein
MLALVIVIPAILALLFGVMSLGAVLTAWAWNTFMPLVWATAPKLTFWAAFAFGVLISTLRGIFHFSINNKKD